MCSVFDLGSRSKPPNDPQARPVVLFDMDGTLTDPADGIVSCHRWALEQVGVHVADDDLDALTGAAAEEMHATLGVPAGQVAETTRLYRERFALAGWLEDTPYPGIPELLGELADGGWVIGVATMKLEPFAERIVDRVKLRSRLTVVAGSDSARTRITKRAVIEHALSRLDFTPSGVAMVGDRHHDVTAARSLGFTAIGVTWGFGSVEELVGADATSIANSPSEVAELLLG